MANQEDNGTGAPNEPPQSDADAQEQARRKAAERAAAQDFFARSGGNASPTQVEGILNSMPPEPSAEPPIVEQAPMINITGEQPSPAQPSPLPDTPPQAADTVQQAPTVDVMGEMPEKPAPNPVQSADTAPMVDPDITPPPEPQQAEPESGRRATPPPEPQVDSERSAVPPPPPTPPEEPEGESAQNTAPVAYANEVQGLADGDGPQLDPYPPTDEIDEYFRTRSNLAKTLNAIDGIDGIDDDLKVLRHIHPDHCKMQRNGEAFIGLKNGQSLNILQIPTGREGETMELIGNKNTLTRAFMGLKAAPLSQEQCDAAAELARARGKKTVAAYGKGEVKQRLWLGVMRDNLAQIAADPNARFIPLTNYKPLRGSEVEQQFARELASQPEEVQEAFRRAMEKSGQELSEKKEAKNENTNENENDNTGQQQPETPTAQQPQSPTAPAQPQGGAVSGFMGPQQAGGQQPVIHFAPVIENNAIQTVGGVSREDFQQQQDELRALKQQLGLDTAQSDTVAAQIVENDDAQLRAAQQQGPVTTPPEPPEPPASPAAEAPPPESSVKISETINVGTPEAATPPEADRLTVPETNRPTMSTIEATPDGRVTLGIEDVPQDQRATQLDIKSPVRVVESIKIGTPEEPQASDSSNARKLITPATLGDNNAPSGAFSDGKPSISTPADDSLRSAAASAFDNQQPVSLQRDKPKAGRPTSKGLGM
ncbi:MAG: hypothetical protein OXT65_07305 [Alphaproteobacteria bacterium]|nr:hypothetical protein [Alphaproteobacteria bacterium]